MDRCLRLGQSVLLFSCALTDAYPTDYQGVVAWMVMDRCLRLGQSVLLFSRARLDAYPTDYQGVVAWMVMDRCLRLGQSVLLFSRARLDAYPTDYQGVVAWMVMDRGLRLGQSVLRGNRARLDAHPTDYQGVVAWMVMDRCCALANPSYFNGLPPDSGRHHSPWLPHQSALGVQSASRKRACCFSRAGFCRCCIWRSHSWCFPGSKRGSRAGIWALVSARN